MQTVFIILGSLIGLIVILVAIASTQSSTYTITARTNIRRNRKDVYDYARQVRNGSEYNKWMMMDPGMEKTYRNEPDGQVGFVYGWNSTNKKVGKGEQEISRLKENESIAFFLRFFEPFQDTAEASFVFTDGADGSTDVAWNMSGQRNLMVKVVHLVFQLPKALQNDLQTSLNNMRSKLEA